MNMKAISTALRMVFRNPRYGIGAGAIALVIFAVAAIFPNISLVLDILRSRISFGAKIEFLFSLIGGISASSGSLSATLTLIIAMLFGIVIAMTVYRLKRNAKNGATHAFGLSFGALFAGTLGIGCAACGSLIGSALLPFIGATGALALLPLGGAEFSIASIALLLLSIVLISRKITSPLVCD